VSRRAFIVLSVVLDAVIYNAAIVVAFLVRFGGQLPAFNVHPYQLVSPLLTAYLLASAYIYGLYEPERTEGFWPMVRATVIAVTLSTVLTLVTLQLAGPGFDAFPRLVILIAWPLQVLFIAGWRLIGTRLTPIRWPEQRVLIVGTGRLATDLADELCGLGRWGYNVVGLVARDEAAATQARATDERVLGAVPDLTRLVSENEVSRVIVTSPVALRELVEDITLSGESDVRIDVVPELYEIFIGRVDSIVADIPLMEITHSTSQSAYASFKGVIDLVFSIVFLIVLSPVLLLTALAVLVSTGRPVFYLQERVGRDLKPIRVIKFRTMVRNAEELSGPVLAEDSDPRVTPIGRFLRLVRIDELPQLVNIAKGEMSFVGPRPERPFFVEQFLQTIPGYRERFRIKPGVTGLAQVSGHYATTPERKLKYDLIYMYHQNLLMDVQIFVDTIRVILTGRGAR
jgi:exopolysaccharide biosynthesis polyprenyl glycosylphosphotransferase